MKHLLRRLFFYLFTAMAAVTVNFFIPRLIPGDPVNSLIARSQGLISTKAEASLRILFGLNGDPLYKQYGDYLHKLFIEHDLGVSFTFFPTPVLGVIRQSILWTVFLVGTTTVLSFIIGTAIGVFLGWRRGSIADAFLPLTTFLAAVPYFFFGLIVIDVMAGPHSFFPSSGGYSPGEVPGWTWHFVSSALVHSLLPGFTILVSSVAGWILGMRNMMVTVASEDYITVAHAKGLSERRVMLSYAARNALLPSISGFALALGFIVGGTFLVEIVFSYPGIGLQLFAATQSKDYPLMQGIFLIITLSVLAANFLADLVYLLLDPRTRKEG
ncbi:MAG: peptide/nickel transport system permease protein [Frankiaceae bacterium]|jgi:peptide/nickel transport system permease protein|nr:peptide/nickel transport system permease protein [Frankiaceae bacterium]